MLSEDDVMPCMVDPFPGAGYAAMAKSASSAGSSWNAPPETTVYPITFFMARDIPMENSASSLRMYSLKESPVHLPIFCICVSLYPLRERALAPPPRRDVGSVCPLAEWGCRELFGI